MPPETTSIADLSQPIDPTTVFETVWDANCGTGESPVYDARRNFIWFCDSPACRILALDLNTGERHRFHLPDVVGSLGLCRDGSLVVALRHSVGIFVPETGEFRVLAEIRGLPEHIRLNDGKVGPDGAFWVGGVDMRRHKEAVAKLYRVDVAGQVEEKVDGLIASNGLAWSPDAATIYLSDSRAQWVDRWTFDSSSGAITKRRRFLTLSVEQGRPDGAACDQDGNYWSAGVSAGCLNCFSPEGQLLVRYRVPVPAPTMPCFVPGWVYVTSLWSGLPQQVLLASPTSGGLFRMPTAVTGVPLTLFDVG